MIARHRLALCSKGMLILSLVAGSASSVLAQTSAVSATARNPATMPALERFRDSRPMVVAHRGCWQGTAENSLASLKSCINKGVDAAEIDIHATKEGALVLLHDDSLDRTTQLVGPLSTFTLAEVANAKLREGQGGPGSRLTSENVPAFAQVLRLAKGRLILFLDIKCQGCEEAVAKQVEAEGAQEWVIFVGGMKIQYRTDWTRNRTLTWINDCRVQPQFPDMVPCFNSFVDGVKAFGPDWPRLFIPVSKETSFYTAASSDPTVRGMKAVVGAWISDKEKKTAEEILSESRRQWALFLKAGSPAIIVDYPDELIALIHELGVAGQVRRVPLEGAANFRDLGGYAAAGNKRVRWGLLYRSDALDSLSTADLKLLSQLNVARITDFRSHSEVAKRPDRLPAELAARRVHAPWDEVLPRAGSPGAKEMEAANGAFTKALELPDEETKLETIDRLIVNHYYPRFVRDGRSTYSRWLHSLLEGPNDSARIFHCTGGADRTGFAAAILLLVLGVPREQIIEDYLLTNELLFSPRGRALLEEKGIAAMPPGYQLKARYLEASFEAMEDDFGSIDNYLRHGLGISDELKRELRARYLE